MAAVISSTDTDYIIQAEQCLKTAREIADRDARCAQRERAAELLKLAEAVSQL
jgi:hypothetical protein